MIAFIPACLFLYYGIENIQEAFFEFTGMEDAEESDEPFPFDPFMVIFPVELLLQNQRL